MIWIYLVALVIGLMRFTIPVHQPTLPLTFEAVAHLFLGFLIGVAVTTKERDKFVGAWTTVAALCVVELLCFFLKL